MSSSGPGRKPHISNSKIKKVKCRVETCQELVASQNYGRHLARSHPSEDSNDRRTYNQNKFSFGASHATTRPPKEDTAEDNLMKEGDRDDGGSLCEGIEDINDNVFNDPSGEVFITERKRARVEENESEANIDEDLSEIENKIDLVIEGLKLVTPNTQGTVLDTIKYKLDYILKTVKVSTAVEELEQVVKEVKAMTMSGERGEEVIGEKEDIDRVLVACKNIVEIETKVPEFKFEEENRKVVCNVCKSEFKYDVSLEVGKKQSDGLVNLKNNLKNHLKKSATHKTALSNTEVQDKIHQKEASRNVKCGMNLARTAYHILSNGRPTSDFTELLSMQHSNGCDIGDINHSSHFITKMASSFSTVITERVKEHLCTKLPQTGCLPPCKVVEDGATYKHDTRILIGLTTVFPGSKPLIQSVFCGAPKGTKSDGASIAETMFTTVSPFIKPEQYLGTSEDGANFLAHVGELLDELFGVEGHHDWDGTHAAATIDTGLRNPKKEWAKEFEWIMEIITTISKAFRFINWGMEWERFCKVRLKKIELV